MLDDFDHSNGPSESCDSPLLSMIHWSCRDGSCDGGGGSLNYSCRRRRFLAVVLLSPVPSNDGQDRIA